MMSRMSRIAGMALLIAASAACGQPFRGESVAIAYDQKGIDAAGGRAYTHLWTGTSVAIDLRSRAIAAKWPNGCEGSRGIAYDARSHFLFAGCAEGKAVVMDAAHGGKVLATASSGAGVDIIDSIRSAGTSMYPVAAARR